MAKEVLHKIRKLRENKDLSQEHLADRLGISQSTYAKIESGLIKLDLLRLEKIASILGEPVGYFVNKKEDRQKNEIPLVDPYDDQRKGPDWNIDEAAEDIYKRSRFAGFKIQEKALLRKEPNTQVQILEVAYSDQLGDFIYKVITDKMKVIRYVPEYLLKKN